MKKIIFIVVAVIGLSFCVNAQVCKINGTNDNVEVMSCNIVGNQVLVKVSNDSRDISANVTVSVTVEYAHASGGGCGTKTASLSGKTQSFANDYATIEIDIPIKDGYKPCRVEATSILGTKCM
jgi:hypothetical protein